MPSRQRTADLRHEASLILGVSQSSRGELGGAQLVGGSGELGVLAHCLPRARRLHPGRKNARGAIVLAELSLIEP